MGIGRSSDGVGSCVFLLFFFLEISLPLPILLIFVPSLSNFASLQQFESNVSLHRRKTKPVPVIWSTPMSVVTGLKKGIVRPR